MIRSDATLSADTHRQIVMMTNTKIKSRSRMIVRFMKCSLKMINYLYGQYCPILSINGQQYAWRLMEACK